MSNIDIKKELAALRSMATQIAQRASRLEKELVPAGTGPAPRKGRQPECVRIAMERYHRRQMKKLNR